jgi:putative heme iron utilization protein
VDTTSERFDPVRVARRLMRESVDGALATLAADGAPYASLVTIATLADNSPLLLLSNLARHTQNIGRDPRVSLLLEQRGAGDPLAGARVSIGGRIVRTDDATARRRFVVRHPEAASYAEFRDFSFWRIEVEGAHLVAGFGRIVDLPGAELLTRIDDAVELLAAEEGAIAHMNADHREAVALYATHLLGAQPGGWEIIGIDPDGCDLMSGGRVRRLDFPRRVTEPAGLRKILAALAQQARAHRES